MNQLERRRQYVDSSRTNIERNKRFYVVGQATVFRCRSVAFVCLDSSVEAFDRQYWSPFAILKSETAMRKKSSIPKGNQNQKDKLYHIISVKKLAS
jgi:hypothetical protein